VAETTRSRRPRIIGVVVSDKMQKTIRVEQKVLVRHPFLEKQVRQRRTFVAHDPTGEARVGDEVEIMHTRPLSKTKRWRLVRVLRREAVHRAEPSTLTADTPAQTDTPSEA